MRCLKRFVAREIFHALTKPEPDTPTGPQLRHERETAGITLKALAAGLGKAPIQISRLERQIENNTATTRQALAWINQSHH